eukprot:758993-Pleurochrysis_carterae.AAC.1
MCSSLSRSSLIFVARALTHPTAFELNVRSPTFFETAASAQRSCAGAILTPCSPRASLTCVLAHDTAAWAACRHDALVCSLRDAFPTAHAPFLTPCKPTSFRHRSSQPRPAFPLTTPVGPFS